jgi:hypothetical protein
MACIWKSICVPCNQEARHPRFLYSLFHWSTVMGMVVVPSALASIHGNRATSEKNSVVS